jgi:SRSO17 transposase
MADGAVPEAVLFDDCIVRPATLLPLLGRLRAFAARYRPRLRRRAQSRHLLTVVEGLLSQLQRKTVEPIAVEHGQDRRALQNFVGAGAWDDDAVLDELRGHVAEEIGDPDAVLVVDGSAFHKQGPESVGVKRQWCGRLGKLDNCQIGVFLGYASPKGHTLVDRRLYLPEDWTSDQARRRKCHVPGDVGFETSWQIAAAMVEAHSRSLPHSWVAADDEFGRSHGFRDGLAGRGERYIVDVPCNTRIRPENARRRSRDQREGFRRVDRWARSLPPSAWTKVLVRAGERGPLEFLAVCATVETMRDNGRPGPTERLLVLKTTNRRPQVTFHLSNASDDVPLVALVRASRERHRIEETFERGKGEVGLAHYEVRSWVGRHHHMTLALLAIFFLVLEQRRIGGENPGDDGAAGRGRARTAVA